MNVIDIEGLKRLSGNDMDFINEILTLYTERTLKDMDELKKARSAKDWNNVRFIVHRMRSAAVPLGLKSLVILLKKVEIKLKENDLTNVETELDEIISISEKAMDDANQKLKVAS